MAMAYDGTMNTQTLYLVRGTKDRPPFADFDRGRLAHFVEPGTEIHELDTRGNASDYSPSLFAGLAHMAQNLRRDAKTFGVEIELHLELQKHGDTIVITRGKAELLQAIVEATDNSPGYARGILAGESISFGSMLDLDIAIGRALKGSPETPS